MKASGHLYAEHGVCLTNLHYPPVFDDGNYTSSY